MSKRSLLQYDDSPPHAAKHRWDRTHADFVRDEEGKLVGKCSCSIDLEQAQRLLDEGIHWRRSTSRKPFPEKVFNVFQGVPYRAHVQAPRKYHGFPELPSRIPGGPDGDIGSELRDRAQNEGYGEQFDAWIERWRDEP